MELKDLKQNYIYTGPIYRNYPPQELRKDRKKRKDRQQATIIYIVCSIVLILITITIILRAAQNLAARAEDTQALLPYKETIHYNNGTNVTTYFVTLKLYPYIKKKYLSKYELEKIRFRNHQHLKWIEKVKPVEIIGFSTRQEFIYFYLYFLYKLTM